MSRSRTFLLIIFSVAPFNKIILFSKNLITFILLIVSIMPWSVINFKSLSHSSTLEIIVSLFSSNFSPIFSINFSGFSKGERPKGKKPPNYAILNSCIFDNFVLADELLEKCLQGLDTCLSVNKNLCGKLVSSLEPPITFDERFKVTSAPSCIPYFNLLSCELDNFCELDI